jgi:hypothetical protein
MLQQHNFVFTGNKQQFIVPLGVTSVHINAVGAGGAHLLNNIHLGQVGTGRPAGKGGRVNGDLIVTPGETLNIYVGANHGSDSGDSGGYNGGGHGYAKDTHKPTYANGGGASDVRKGGELLEDRVIVAGGGGGSGGYHWRHFNSAAGGGGIYIQPNFHGGGGGSGFNFKGEDGDKQGGDSGGARDGGGGGGGGLFSGGKGAENTWYPTLPYAENGTIGQGGASNQSDSCLDLGIGGGGGGYYGGGGAAAGDCGGGQGGGGSSWTKPGVITNPVFVPGAGILGDNGKIEISYTVVDILFEPCLKKGTLIKTPLGCYPIESLNPGDKIINQFGNEIEIVNIVKSKRISNNFNILKKNALGRNVPNKDLIISDDHIVRHEGILYLPRNSNKFKRLPKQEIEYYHIETNDYINDWFIANNCLVETFTKGSNKSNLIERRRRVSNRRNKNSNRRKLL